MWYFKCTGSDVQEGLGGWVASWVADDRSGPEFRCPTSLQTAKQLFQLDGPITWLEITNCDLYSDFSETYFLMGKKKKSWESPDCRISRGSKNRGEKKWYSNTWQEAKWSVSHVFNKCKICLSFVPWLQSSWLDNGGFSMWPSDSFTDSFSEDSISFILWNKRKNPTLSSLSSASLGRGWSVSLKRAGFRIQKLAAQ